MHLTLNGLTDILQLGLNGHVLYSKQRVRKLDGGDVMLLAQALNDLPSGVIFAKGTIGKS